MKKLLFNTQSTLVVLIAFIFSFNTVKAQWVAQTSNVTTGYYVPFIDAVDANVAWGIVADPLGQLNPVQEFTRTIDGGQTWAGGSITNATGLCPSGISAIDANNAWAIMFNPGGGQGKVLHTNDGGASWTHQSTALFNASGNFPDWIYFWDNNNGVCMGDPTNNYYEIYTTNNGGANWIREPSVNIPAPLGGEFGITNVFTHEGDSTIFFGTNLGRIYKSVDRGHTWIATQTPFGDFIGAIAFRDANHGLAVSGGATGSTDVAYTANGGLTWNLKGTNTAGMSLILGMCYVPGTDSTYFISTPAAGSVDGTAYSMNDGSTWSLVDNLIHTGIDFVDDSTGWTGSNMTDINGINLMYKWSTSLNIPENEVASQKILTCFNTGSYTQNPKAVFVNNGLNAQTFNVTMNISGGYTSTKTVTNIAYTNTQTITFDPWTPAATGPYAITIYTSLAGDFDPNNDTLTKTVTVYDGFENYGWTIKPNIPVTTFGLAGAFNLNGNATSSPGTYYSIGGADFTAVQPGTNMFSTVPGTWSATSPMPSAKYQFSAQKVGNNMYCIGGYSGGFTAVPSNYYYDVTTNLWNTGLDMPLPTGDYASGVYADSLIYYIGGFDGAADQNVVQIYNVNTNAWTTGTSKPGTEVSGLRGSINGNTIVIAGGFSQNLGAEISDAYIGTIDPVDPTIITWTALPAYPGGPVGRLAAGTVFRNLKPLILFTGGDPDGTGASTICDCWAYDIANSQWLAGEGKPTAVSNISDFAGLVYNDSLWMASSAGYDGVNLSTAHEWLNLGPSPSTGFCGAAASVVNPCSGMCNGSITVTPVNGIPPYNYVWSTGDSVTFVDSLCAGGYSITIQDSAGCSSTTQVTLVTPVITASAANVLCNGACNGIASVSLQGGSAPFTYLWSNAATTDSVMNLCPAIYQVGVMDNNQCVDSTTVTITEPDTFSATFTGIDVLCAGLCHGSFTNSVTGGTAPYAFSDCNGLPLVPGTLCPGNYCVVITDVNGCTVSNSSGFIVNAPGALVVSSSIQNPSCNGCINGFIAINASGGSGLYTITWTPPGGNLSNDSIINLGDGVYVVTVQDANGCATSFIDTLSEPSGIFYHNSVSNDFIVLYPNPANTALTVEVKENAEFSSISVTDVSGRKVKTEIVTKGQKILHINIAELEAGVYFLNAVKADGTASGYLKFVKE